MPTFPYFNSGYLQEEMDYFHKPTEPTTPPVTEPAVVVQAAPEVTEAMLESGAQALANDVWHPPQPLASLSRLEANKFRRQALLVLKAALSRPSTATEGV
jgi:hypothetical protein